MYLHEIRQNTAPAPAGVSKSFPSVEVVSTTPIPAHGVENTTTAEGFALRHGPSVTIEL